MELAKKENSAKGAIKHPADLRERSLGGAIFLVAIADYRSADELEHKNAKRFLYPQTRKWQNHYDWAVGLAGGLNPAWLRDALDKCKAKWDEQHASAARRAGRNQSKSDRRDKPNEKQRGHRIHHDGLRVPRKHARSFDPAVQPARETCSARAGDVAPGL
jgi:hypothetical protein